MHYLTLITADIPPLEEDVQANKAVAEQMNRLKKEKELVPKESLCMLDLLLESCNNIRDTFSRAVASSARSILNRYYCDTENPDYLAFWDKTQELETAYEKTVDCFQLPNGRIVPDYHSSACHFIIRNGLVYKRYAGSLHHPKRTKSAKRIKALPNYPIKKLYPTISDYATEYWGYSYHPEQEAYGFYYNPDAFFDWYSIGGRWPALFLVKEDCHEYSIGEKSYHYYEDKIPCPKGYKWACAARKKDIEWQAITNWHLLNVRKHFCSLEKLFLTGERDKDILGIVTEDGILYDKKLIYEKGETEEQYLTRRNLNEVRRYPIIFYAFLGENGSQTQDDIVSCNTTDYNSNNWQVTLEQYIDSLSDDTVLIGIDCHM